jgi:iron complex transport system substrate-binding protein
VLGHSGNEEALAPIAKAGVPVLIFSPSSLEGVYASIDTIGKATGATARATALVASIKAQVQAVADTAAKTGASPRVVYALDTTLWTAGPGSFVDDLIRLAHGINVAAENAGPATSAYFQLAAEQLAALNPDVILLPNTAFKSATEFTSDPRFAGLNAVKDGRVMVIDDVVVTRPGPRIAEGLKVLAAAIHPGTF